MGVEVSKPMTDLEMAQRLGLPVLPIPIREDVTVVIHPMPLDLTKAEAEKIARVILAYAMEGPDR